VQITKEAYSNEGLVRGSSTTHWQNGATLSATGDRAILWVVE
jgi:hypothetical protein